MRIVTTPAELMDKGLWEDYCLLLGTNPYAVNEGLMGRNEKISLTANLARTLGLSV